jgi:hypothetical protein
VADGSERRQEEELELNGVDADDSADEGDVGDDTGDDQDGEVNVEEESQDQAEEGAEDTDETPSSEPDQDAAESSSEAATDQSADPDDIEEKVPALESPSLANSTARSPESEYTLDSEFAALMPKKSADELKLLQEEFDAAGGFRDPLIVWNGLLLDGYNRHAIATAAGCKCAVIRISLPDRESAIEWVVRNPLARRNLSGPALAYFRGLLYAAQERRQGQRNNLTSGQNVQKSSAAVELGEQHKVDERTIRRDSKFATQLDALVQKHGEAIRTKILSGEVKGAKTVVERLAELADDNQPIEVANVVSTGKIIGQPRARAASNPLDSAWAKADTRARKKFLKSILADEATAGIARGFLD